MSKVAVISNREVGNIWMAHIVGELYEAWPRRRDFSSLDVGVATASDPSEDPEDFFDDLTLWLNCWPDRTNQGNRRSKRSPDLTTAQRRPPPPPPVRLRRRASGRDCVPETA